MKLYTVCKKYLVSELEEIILQAFERFITGPHSAIVAQRPRLDGNIVHDDPSMDGAEKFTQVFRRHKSCHYGSPSTEAMLKTLYEGTLKGDKLRALFVEAVFHRRHAICLRVCDRKALKEFYINIPDFADDLAVRELESIARNAADSKPSVQGLFVEWLTGQSRDEGADHVKVGS